MSDRFALRAVYLSGIAARALGWRPNEFWAATPAELAAILAPDEDTSTAPLGRTDLTRLMESDDARPFR